MKFTVTWNKTRTRSVGLGLALALLALGLAVMAGTAAADSRGPTLQANAAQRAQPAAPEGDGVWTPLGGPIGEGGQVNALAVHPTISGTVYAAVAPPGAYDSGPSIIYKTTNGAATWTPVFTAEHQVYSLGVTGTVVYAGAFNPGGEGANIYASHDSGATWTPVFTWTDRGVWLDVSVHPTDTDVATVPGLHDGIASNGTVVSFETSLGTMDATALTFRGVATATLTTGGAGGPAVVTATVDGFADTTTVDFGDYRIYLPIVVKND